MTFDIENLSTLDPTNPRDQDILVAVSAALSPDGVSAYPKVLELVRQNGSKEAAYDALLVQMPTLEYDLNTLRIFMGLAMRAEREIRASN